MGVNNKMFVIRNEELERIWRLLWEDEPHGKRPSVVERVIRLEITI